MRTVDDLMAVLSMYRITNVPIEADKEILNMDDSDENFCELIEEAGIAEHSVSTKVGVNNSKVGVGSEEKHEKHLYAESYEWFEISRRVD